MEMNASRTTWFSEDPDRRWAEKFFLAYMPVWIAIIAFCMLTHAYASWRDVGWLSLGLLVALPQVVLPFVLAPTKRAKLYAAKFNAWVWLFNFAGNYIFTRYVEDLFGLHYIVPTTLNLGAQGVGTVRAPVPFVMFLLTQAYFTTYFTVMFMAFRRAGRKWPLWIPLAFAMAFAETAAMASPLIADMFWYDDKTRMLVWGSMSYGSGFLVSAPLLFRMQADWKWQRVIIEALAACMLQFYAYEGWTWILTR